jgi:hypothetical protein
MEQFLNSNWLWKTNRWWLHQVFFCAFLWSCFAILGGLINHDSWVWRLEVILTFWIVTAIVWIVSWLNYQMSNENVK